MKKKTQMKGYSVQRIVSSLLAGLFVAALAVGQGFLGCGEDQDRNDPSLPFVAMPGSGAGCARMPGGSGSGSCERDRWRTDYTGTCEIECTHILWPFPPTWYTDTWNVSAYVTRWGCTDDFWGMKSYLEAIAANHLFNRCLTHDTAAVCGGSGSWYEPNGVGFVVTGPICSEASPYLW